MMSKRSPAVACVDRRFSGSHPTETVAQAPPSQVAHDWDGHESYPRDFGGL